MFVGNYVHSVDEKGRLSLPAKFRERLGASFVTTHGLDGCLFVYPMPEWETISNRLRDLSTTKSNARAFSRLFFANAQECECDKQGRVSLPLHQREHAALSGETVIIGANSRVEIWSAENWARYKKLVQSDYEALAEDLQTPI
ncbi:MAG: Transcriptional regulator MraZ [Firmicutes bacterium]|nr:Transcriptional regulator MraZ [candidate division NPL-UPA2 bacterium]